MVTAIDAAQLMTMTYGHLKIETEPSGEVHKPFDPHTAPIRFRATVGLSEQEWQEYLTAVGGGAGPAAGIEELRDRKSFRDSATHVGLQLPKSITEVGEALADAKIRWTPKPSHDDMVQTERGSPPAAWQNPSTPDGTLMYPVTMESPVRAAGTFVLDTQTEAKPDHGSCAPGGCASGRSLCGRR